MRAGFLKIKRVWKLEILKVEVLRRLKTPETVDRRWKSCRCEGELERGAKPA